MTPFFDTNLLLDLFAKDDPRTAIAERLLALGAERDSHAASTARSDLCRDSRHSASDRRTIRVSYL